MFEGDRSLWTVRSGKYKNADLKDSLAPHSGNSFYLFDAWSGASSAGTREALISNCLQLPASGDVTTVGFWMSHDTSYTANPLGTSYDSLYFIVSTDKGQTWTRLSGYRRNDPAFAIPGWKQENVNLSAYAGQLIQIGFEGVSDYGNIIGLDDITVTVYSLPVTMLTFTGERISTRNLLKWSTATEINNKGFEIERSIDGINFSGLGVVASKGDRGNSTRNLSYEFTDNTPFASTSYYRLRQVDFDGKSKLSNVVMIKGAKASGIVLSGVYPNPTVGKLNLAIASSTNDKVTILVTDLAGKVVLQNSAQLINGDNNIQLNVKNIATGAYSVKVICNNGCNSGSAAFIKQ